MVYWVYPKISLYICERISSRLKNEFESTMENEPSVFESLKFYGMAYSNNPKYWDRQDRANSLDPDQTPQTRRLIRVYTVCHSSNTVLDTSINWQ